MSTLLFETDQEEPTDRIVRWLWSDEWYTRTPWELEGTILPYFSNTVQDCGGGVIFKLRTIGPLARMEAYVDGER